VVCLRRPWPGATRAGPAGGHRSVPLGELVEEYAHRHERAHDHDAKKDEVAARDHFPRMAHEELQAGPLVRVAAAQPNWTHQQRKEAVPACPGLQVRIGHTLQRSGRLTDSKAIPIPDPVARGLSVSFPPPGDIHPHMQQPFAVPSRLVDPHGASCRRNGSSTGSPRRTLRGSRGPVDGR